MIQWDNVHPKGLVNLKACELSRLVHFLIEQCREMLLTDSTVSDGICVPLASLTLWDMLGTQR